MPSVTGQEQDAPGTSVTDREVILELNGISKRFGPTQALSDVHLDVRRGEIHALLGHNGAGKSTLIKTLAGVNIPDQGSISINGVPASITGPKDALAAGISVVYQELSLFGSLTVAENLVGSTGGGLDLGGGLVRRGAINKRAAQELQQMGLDIDPDRKVDSLPIGEQQMVEIGRALFSGAQIVVLDEPTSALSPAETEVLFDLVQSMARKGVSFILISHFLDEIMDNADRVTVMRAGRAVDTVEVSRTSKRDLLALSLGDPDNVMTSTYGDSTTTLPPRMEGPLVLRATGVHVAPRVRSFDLHVHRGEIVSVYGEIGSGHEDFADTVFGMQSLSGGELVVLGHLVYRADSELMREYGVGYIPSDRRRALALEKSVSDNISIAALRHVSSGPLRPLRERKLAQRLIDRLGIRGARPTLPINGLSGGNQQKALIARWLVHPPRLLVLCEPTRGMDLRAKSDVLRTVADLRDRGTSVLLITSEPETALAIADRVLVARRGEIVTDFSDCTLTNRDLIEATL
ncbi:sugar ABC transporter ATP-binding protein [Rhodococcus sp. ABRD24]|uniref:sugar ABC transporter ATP-binding protein n=1 Tax=Rhodococcus sp. ABRD24 TaxID=2507582 RepID=UPI00103FCF69|nr:sugar ABC transporter ATP-binding protein [Rhodococcus sp. ABRD24]QBJ96605.1 sugar ABC transporter ATP-binding protein [Rhodococcus sp. ABRD24]